MAYWDFAHESVGGRWAFNLAKTEMTRPLTMILWPIGTSRMKA